MVVASGELDGHSAERLGPYLRRLQSGNDLIVDLWDILSCDSEAIEVLEEAKQRADDAGWGFAAVVDPAGPCAKAFETAGVAIATFHDRHTARAALQHSPS